MTSKTVIEEDGTIALFKDWVLADGSTEFQPEADRYHLYVQVLCPFANRALIGRKLKGLDAVIPITNTDWLNEQGKGWRFYPEREGCDADPIHGAKYLREIYEMSAKKLGASGFKGSVTVPVLFDKKLGRVVSQESADILRMFNSEFNEFCATPAHKNLDLFPKDMRSQIEEVEEWTQKGIIFGLYAPLMAKEQEQYDNAIKQLYASLDQAEALLSKQRFLCGKQMTEADVRLFAALIRFDVAYANCGCTKKRIVDYPALFGYVKDIYQTPGVKDTVDFDQIFKGYMIGSWQLQPIFNPKKLVYALPDIDYESAHNRENL